MNTNLTSSAGIRDWNDVSKNWRINAYLTSPVTGEPLDLPAEALSESSSELQEAEGRADSAD